MQQRAWQIYNRPSYRPNLVHLCRVAHRAGAKRGPVRSKQAQDTLAAPNAHRPSAKVRCARDPIRIGISIGSYHRIAQDAIERFIRIEHERPRRANMAERKRSRIDKAAPLALNDACACIGGDFSGRVGRKRIQHEYFATIRQTCEGPRQIGFLVFGEDDRGYRFGIQVVIDGASAAPEAEVLL